MEKKQKSETEAKNFMWASAILDKNQVEKEDGFNFKVQDHRVTLAKDQGTCSCEFYETTGRKCCHISAAQQFYLQISMLVLFSVLDIIN